MTTPPFWTGAFTNLLILLYAGGIPVGGAYRPGPGLVIPTPPQITLTRYSEVDSTQGESVAQKFPGQTGAFENDFVSKNGSDYVIYEGVESVAFSCEADYPISWKAPALPGDQFNFQFVSVYEFRRAEVTPTWVTPANKRYILFLYIQSSNANFVSVGVTCGSVEGTPGQETTIHLYKMGKEVIENEGKTVTVYATPPDTAPFNDLSPLVIPCRPSSPNLQLSLEKQISVPSENEPHKMDTLWSPVKPSGSEVTFDPQIGFTIQRTHLGISIFGLYRCFVTPLEEDNPDGDNLDPSTAQVVLVNVLRETARNNQTVAPSGGGIPFEEKMVVSGKASFSIASDGISYGTVKCCTGKVGKPPKLLTRYCNNPIKCQWDRENILKDEATTTAFNDHITRTRHPTLGKLERDCSQITLLGMSNVVRCTGDDVDVLQHYVTLFTPDAGGPVANRSQKLQPVQRGKPLRTGKVSRIPTEFVQLSKYEKASAAENVGVSRKMLLLVGDRIRGRPGGKGRMGSNHVVSNSVILSLLTGNHKAPAKTLFVYEYDRDVYFSGEPLNFLCLGIPNFYARGVFMRVNWRNGTNTAIRTNSTLEGEGQEADIFFVYLANNARFPGGTGEGLSVAVGEPIIAREDMDSVECFMPVAGSSKWDRISKKVQVVPSVAPKFLEAEEENVYFYVGEGNRTVSCTLKEGAPFPEMKVYRDGQPLKVTLPGNSGTSNKTVDQRQNDTRATETVGRGKVVARVEINFDAVTHSNQNVFQCNASNIKGVASRTIRIFVIDKPNRVVPLVLGILGVLGVTLLGFGMGRWFSRRRGP